MKLTWPRSNSLVTLLLIYSVTGTIAFHVPFVVDAFATNFSYILVRRSPVSTQRTYLNDETQHLLPGPGTIHTSTSVYPAVSMDS